LNSLINPKSQRQIKKQLHLILQEADWEKKISTLSDKADLPKKLISPLFSTLYSKSFEIKSRGISCFGIVVPTIAKSNLEDARIIMRRLIWNLNDESGGIGWGSPEAQAEIMANHQQLAKEFYRVFLSYIILRDGPDNYLEYEPLREGVYWGIARLSQARPELIQPYSTLLIQALSLENSPQIYAYLCLAFTNLKTREDDLRPILQKIAKRKDNLTIFWDKSMQTLPLTQLVHKALDQTNSS